MKSTQDSQNVVFENVWEKDVTHVRTQVMEIWKQNAGPAADKVNERLQQLVFVVKNNKGDVVAVSTAFKAHIRQLRNYFFAIRLMIIPSYRVPGLPSKLLVTTRDFLESVHHLDTTEPCIGLITLVENKRLRENRNEAIWPASKMVYIGNSKSGDHIRVYYFKGARIVP